VKLCLSDEGAELRSLESNRCPFRIVLVIGIAATRGRHHCAVVLRQVRQAFACPCTLGLKSTARSIHVLNPDATYKRRATASAADDVPRASRRAETQEGERDPIVVVTFAGTSWTLNVRASPSDWERLSDPKGCH
jgi:hypothetical protein